MTSCCRLDENADSRLFIPFLALFILSYLTIGALIFSNLEGPQEIRDLADLEKSLKELAQRTNLTYEYLSEILMEYDLFAMKGYSVNDLQNEHAHSKKWSFFGSLAFCGTVVTTMGFGIATPNSSAARVVFIFYCLLGCPAAFLFFNTCLLRFIEYFTIFMSWIKRRRKGRRRLSRGRERPKPYKASPTHVLMALFSLTLVYVTMTSLVYEAAESEWDFLTSLYYCFTAFSTIGFGDLVSGQDHDYDTINRYIYHLIDAVMVTIGCCSVYALFNMTSLFVKKLIDHAIKKIKSLCVTSSPRDSNQPDEMEWLSVYGFPRKGGKGNRDDNAEEVNFRKRAMKKSRSPAHSEPVVIGDDVTVCDDVMEKNNHVFESGEPRDIVMKEEDAEKAIPPSRTNSKRRWKTLYAVLRTVNRRPTPSQSPGKSISHQASGEKYHKDDDVATFMTSLQKTLREKRGIELLFWPPGESSRTERPRSRRSSDPGGLIGRSASSSDPNRLSRSLFVRISPGIEPPRLEQKDSTGWEESSDVFPLSIMQSKMA